MDNEIVIKNGIRSISITESQTSIFVNKDTDYIPTQVGRKGIYNMIYAETNKTTVYVKV